MADKIKTEILSKFKQDKKLVILVCIGIAAVVLFIFSNNYSKNEVKSEENSTSNISTEEENGVENELETRLEKLILKMNGVNSVDVMVILNSSGEHIYAVNSKTENNGDKNSSNSEVVLFENQNGNNEGLLVSTKTPEIAGVAVVCDGAESEIIKAEITKLITNLFGIGANRVYVGSN